MSSAPGPLSLVRMLCAIRSLSVLGRPPSACCSHILGFQTRHLSIATTSHQGPEDSKHSTRWGGKNAWKLGFLSITCSGLFGLGFAIAVWGPPEKDEDGSLFRSGWRFKKRPGLDVFLQNLSPYYEVVAFTNESAMTGGPVLMQMDPQGQFIHYRLFREATRYQKGKHIKDLSCLNRDLSRVVFIDWDPEAAKLQPRNSLIVKRWQGNESDRELIDLAAFLRMLAMGSVDDVRTVLEFYSESDDPLALFRERQGQLMDEQAKRKEDAEKALVNRPKPRFSFSGMSRS